MQRQWRSARRRVSAEASLLRLEGARICDVHVRDLSATGACVRLATRDPVVSNLILSCPALGLRAECEIVWRRKFDIGLRILRYERQPVLTSAIRGA